MILTPHPLSSRHSHSNSNDDPCGKAACTCCGPVEFEFPEELMTPEMKKWRAKLGEEAFLEMMKKMM